MVEPEFAQLVQTKNTMYYGLQQGLPSKEFYFNFHE